MVADTTDAVAMTDLSTLTTTGAEASRANVGDAFDGRSLMAWATTGTFSPARLPTQLSMQRVDLS